MEVTSFSEISDNIIYHFPSFCKQGAGTNQKNLRADRADCGAAPPKTAHFLFRKKSRNDPKNKYVFFSFVKKQSGYLLDKQE